MTHKIRVYRKSFYENGKYHEAIGYKAFMEALEKYGLSENLLKRSTKIDVIHSPTSVHTADSSAEIFFFRYQYKTRVEFFGKLAALKDDRFIAQYFWIGD